MKYIFNTIIQTIALMLLFENTIISVANEQMFMTIFISFAISMGFQFLTYRIENLEKDIKEFKENK